MTTSRDVLRAVYDMHADVHLTRAVMWLAVGGSADWLLVRIGCIILAIDCLFKAVAKFGEHEKVEPWHE